MGNYDIAKLNNSSRRLLSLLDDGNVYTITELCEKAKVSRTTYYSALQDDNFVQALFHTTTGKIYSSLPAIMNKIVKQATKGSFAHQKMLLEMIKLYQGVPTQQTNIQINVKPIYSGKSTIVKDSVDSTQEEGQ